MKMIDGYQLGTDMTTAKVEFTLNAGKFMLEILLKYVWFGMLG